MERVGNRKGRIERYCSTGQSPQRAVAPTEEEEEEIVYIDGIIVTMPYAVIYIKV
jgi:hypothetical protein